METLYAFSFKEVAQMLTTLEQYRLLAERTKYFFKQGLSLEEIELISSRKAISIAPGLGGVMSKYGLMLKTQYGVYGKIGGEWTIELEVRLKKEMKLRPEVAYMHFGLIDSNDKGLIMGLSKEAEVGGHPGESLFLGDIKVREKVVYFDDIGCTIADGLTHNIYIEHQGKDETANIIVYVDGDLVVANNFNVKITEFRKLIIGGEAFVEEASINNLLILERLRLRGECEILNAKDIPDKKAVPSGYYELTESTQIIYEDGLLSVFVDNEDN